MFCIVLSFYLFQEALCNKKCIYFLTAKDSYSYPSHPYACNLSMTQIRQARLKKSNKYLARTTKMITNDFSNNVVTNRSNNGTADGEQLDENHHCFQQICPSFMVTKQKNGPRLHLAKLECKSVKFSKFPILGCSNE